MQRLTFDPVLSTVPDRRIDLDEDVAIGREWHTATQTNEIAIVREGFFASMGESLSDWRARRSQRRLS